MAHPKQIGIYCDASAASGIRLVLMFRLEEMCSLRDDALDAGDPEGVHDMRVASRRLRSALRDFLPYLSKRHIAKSLHEIKNVADALGRVRDQDVALLALDKLAHKAPPLVVASINRFAELRRQKREEARAALLRTLDANTLAALRSSFANSLEAAIAAAGRKKSKQEARNGTLVSYRDLARMTILNRLEDLEKLSDSLYYPLSIKPLHRMRIAAKRLRYAIELFENCWGQQAAIFAKKVAVLQSSLGELHDCDLWIDDLGKDLSQVEKQRGTSGAEAAEDDHAAAYIWLLGHFVRLRTKHFRNALAHWYEWETRDFSAHLRNTLVAELPESSASSNGKASGEVADALAASAGET
jgi:CHAD domain-containing protein